MRYDDPELLDQLAAAYVLGTLRGAARRRFARLAQESSAAREAIWAWERRVVPLAEQTPPQPPPTDAWAGIESRLGFASDDRRASAPSAATGWLWKGLSLVLAVALAAVLLPQLVPGDAGTLTPAERLALIQSDEQQPLWVITVDEASGRLQTVAVNVPAREADRVFELWMLPEQGAPRSFGLLPVSARERSERQLSPALLALLARAQGLAVSLEPSGGSPTGAPTGPVLYTAPVIGL